MPTSYMLFLISNTFISNTKLQLEKNQAKTKQHPEAELLLFEIIGFYHPSYLPKIAESILKNI